MKKSLLVVFLLLFVTTTYAQDVTGTWHGRLETMNLRIDIHIEKTNDGYSATFDSPDQGALGIPVTETTFENSELNLSMTSLNASYKGTYSDDNFKGIFSQMGFEIPLKLQRQAIEKKAIRRPQEPKKPFPYHTEDITFTNTDAKITLAGTLSLPKKSEPHAAVILISASGPQDRNEEIEDHKPFLVLADHFTRKGIAVLRFDDRGFGKSTGNFSTATTNDFAADVTSAVLYLKTRKEIDPTKIGLVGHSEGGIIAPLVAEKSPDISFIVLLAGTGIRGDKLLLLQQKLIGKSMGISESELEKSAVINSALFDMIVQDEAPATLKQRLKNKLMAMSDNTDDSESPEGFSKKEAEIALQVSQLTSPWLVNFLKHDPAKVLENVACPVLAVNGEKDLQVPPKENLEAIKAALEKGGNKNSSTLELSNLNHLFQECETGALNEYGSIAQTFAPSALEAISDWVLKQVK